MEAPLYYIVSRQGEGEAATWHRSEPMLCADADASLAAENAAGRTDSKKVDKRLSDAIGLPEGVR